MAKLGKLRLEQTTMGAPSVGAGGHIDLALGTFDRPGPSDKRDKELAITPKEMVATQLATDRPPIEDEDYLPSSLPELAKATAEMSKLVPPEQVEKYYLRMRELTDEFVERQEITTMDDKNMQENQKRKIVKMIHEALNEMTGDDDDFFLTDKNRKLVGFPDIIKAMPEEFADVPPTRRYATALKDSATGSSKIKNIVDKIPDEALDKLHNLAKEEYIDLLEDVMGDDASPDDLSDLMKVPAVELYELSDSYKFFFKAAFVLPAMEIFDKARSKVYRKAINDVENQLSAMGVPTSDAILTIRNQLLGFTDRKPERIKRSYINAAEEGKIRQIDVDRLYKQLMTKFADMESSARARLADDMQKASERFIQNSLEMYSKMSLAQRRDIMQKALQSTAG